MIKDNGVLIERVFRCDKFNKVVNDKNELQLGKYFADCQRPMTDDEIKQFIHGSKYDPQPIISWVVEISKDKYDELNARLVVENMEIEEEHTNQYEIDIEYVKKSVNYRINSLKKDGKKIEQIQHLIPIWLDSFLKMGIITQSFFDPEKRKILIADKVGVVWSFNVE